MVFTLIDFFYFQIGSRSSVYSPESNVRKTGSYIYEEFMPTDGTDVKVGLKYILSLYFEFTSAIRKRVYNSFCCCCCLVVKSCPALWQLHGL